MRRKINTRYRYATPVTRPNDDMELLCLQEHSGNNGQDGCFMALCYSVQRRSLGGRSFRASILSEVWASGATVTVAAKKVDTVHFILIKVRRMPSSRMPSIMSSAATPQLCSKSIIVLTVTINHRRIMTRWHRVSVQCDVELIHILISSLFVPFSSMNLITPSVAVCYAIVRFYMR